MHWVDYQRPESLDAALQAFAANAGNAKALAGGTDLLVQMRAGRCASGVLVDIKNIPELNEMSYSPEQGLTLGAAVPCYRIYGDKTVSAAYPALIDAVSIIGGTQIQGRASVGGNLCNAAPSADVVPVLIALGVVCKVTSAGGTREIAAEDFCVAPGKNALAAGELLVSLHFPPPAPQSGARYIRFIPRNEMDIAVAGAGVSVTLADDRFSAARVALASVAPTPLFVREAGEALVGRPVHAASIAKAAAAAKAAAKPIDDMRGTAAYRRNLCAVLTRRALEDAVARAGGKL